MPYILRRHTVEEEMREDIEKCVKKGMSEPAGTWKGGRETKLALEGEGIKVKHFRFVGDAFINEAMHNRGVDWCNDGSFGSCLALAVH
jgi:hypothetical protein